MRGPGSSRSNRLHDKTSFQLMKNHDLPYIKTLLADDYQEELRQSYELFEYLAQEQNFTFEFIQLPTVTEGKLIISLILPIACFFIPVGLIQLLLEVRVNPISVFHGRGATFDLARAHSANLALKYIRCLSKQQQQHAASNISTISSSA